MEYKTKDNKMEYLHEPQLSNKHQMKMSISSYVQSWNIFKNNNFVAIMTRKILFRHMHRVVVNKDIPSYATDVKISSNRRGECQAGYCLGSSVGRTLICNKNGPSSNPQIDTFSLCCLDEL